MKPTKGKKYAIACLGPYDYNVWKGVAVHDGEIEPHEGWFGFFIPGESKPVWFAEEDIIGEIK